jgi:predicted aconitase
MAGMELTPEEKEMLAGGAGFAARKSLEILVALGEIYGAERLLGVSSVQVAGVSYDNLGDAGLEFLDEMAADGRVRVLTTLNPAGMDVDNWEALGISPEFAGKQKQVIERFTRMGVVATCTCTPYFVGNLPRYAEHIAWSESSAVCFANSVIGARTNREGGPSALAAALTGKTPAYGLHLDRNRVPGRRVDVLHELRDETEFGALGRVVGTRIGAEIPFFTGVGHPDVDLLKALSASIATYGGTAMFHMEGVTPDRAEPPSESIRVLREEIEQAVEEMNDVTEVDFVSIGCPHASLTEIQRIAGLLKDKSVCVETWIHLARPVKQTADRMGYTEIIERAGARLACDTCMVVAPLKGRFRGLATNSAKSVYYGRAKNGFQVVFRNLDECLALAVGGIRSAP